jgi:hypothetical protein
LLQRRGPANSTRSPFRSAAVVTTAAIGRFATKGIASSTQGETLDAAREMVRDAIALVLEERRARGESIPPTGWALVESVEIAA